MTMMASSLALQTLQDALLAAAAKLAAEQKEHAFAEGLAQLREEFSFFEEPIRYEIAIPAMAEAGD